MATPTNQYIPIWETLKLNGNVTLAVHKALHKRVLRGLVNIKDRDLMFKIYADMKKKKYVLEIESEQARVKIKLLEYDDLSNLTVGDL